MSRHTPGPWGFDGDDLRNCDGLYVICHEPDCNGISDADAALIAAAPDLLAALQDAYSIFHAEEGETQLAPKWHARAAAAIAKAEGRS